MRVTCDSNVPHIEGFFFPARSFDYFRQTKLNEITLTPALLALCNMAYWNRPNMLRLLSNYVCATITTLWFVPLPYV
jgi:hypothetical protein